MENAVVAALIFIIPTLLVVIVFGYAGRKVQWTPLLWAAFSFAVYMLLLRSKGVIPQPTVMEGLTLNWLGKGLSLLGTLAILYFLPRVSFRDAGFRWDQKQGSLNQVITVAVLTILAATTTAALVSSSPNTSLEWLLFQATMPGLDEEIFMRGLLLLLFHQAFGKDLVIWGAETGWGLWLTTLLFGLLHGITVHEGELAVSVYAIVATGFIGLIEGWMRERTGSLLMPILFHNGFNVAQSFV